MPDQNQEDMKLPVDDRIISALSHAQQESLAGLADMSRTFVDGITNYNREIVHFLTARVSQDIELQADLSNCQSLPEVMELQNAFIDNAIRQYTEEAERLTKMGAQMLANDFSAVTSRLNVIAEEAEEIEAEMEKEKAS